MRLNKNIQYINIQGYYLNLNKNLFVLVWYLLIRTRPFNLNDKASNRLFRFMPSFLIKFIRIIKILKDIIISKSTKNKMGCEIINAPYDGDILRKVSSGGYKIFSLKEKIVVSQYKLNIKEETFTKIVDNLKFIQKFNVSPKLIAVDYDQKCIYENYENYYKAEFFFENWPYFNKVIYPIWEGILRKFPIEKMDNYNYVLTQKKFLMERLNYLKQENYNSDIITHIVKFVECISHKILQEKHDTKIYMTYTHGDLHAWNILLNGKNATIIDWDTFNKRSLYHDLFYLIIHNLLGGKNVDIRKSLLELNNCLNNSFLILNNERKVSGVFNKELYRWLFYLEYIKLDFDIIWEFDCDRKSINYRLSKINSSISVFREIEKEINRMGG